MLLGRRRSHLWLPLAWTRASSKREVIAIGPASILRCHSATYFRDIQHIQVWLFWKGTP